MVVIGNPNDLPYLSYFYQKFSIFFMASLFPSISLAQQTEPYAPCPISLSKVYLSLSRLHGHYLILALLREFQRNSSFIGVEFNQELSGFKYLQNDEEVQVELQYKVYNKQMSTTLHYKMFIVEEKCELKIKFEDVFFSKVAKIYLHSEFPKRIMPHYYILTNDSTLHFKPSTQLSEKLIIQFKQLVTFVNAIFPNIKTKTIKSILKDSQSLEEREKVIDFQNVLGFKLIRLPFKNYEKGDLILYATNQTSITKIEKELKNFISEQLLFPMQPLLHKKRIQKKFQQVALQEFILKYQQKIQTIAQKFMFRVESLEAFQSKDIQNSAWFLLLDLQGLRFNLNEFFLQFSYFMDSIEIKIIPISDVKSCGYHKIQHKFSNYKINLIDEENLILIDDNIDINNIEAEIKMGKWLIDSRDFQKEQLKVIFHEKKNGNLDDILKTNGLVIQKLQISDERIIVQCDEENYHKLIEELKKYMERFSRETKVVQEFKEQLLIKVFLKYYQNNIKKKYIVSYFQKKKILYQNYFIKNKDEISQALGKIRKHILSELICVPSTKPISLKQIQQKKLNCLYKEVRNPKNYEHENLGRIRFAANDIKIQLLASSNFHSYEDILICFVCDEYQSQNPILTQIINETELRFDLFLSGRKSNRVKKYNLSKSTICNYLYLVFVDLKEINLRYVEKDVNRVQKEIKQHNRVNVCFPTLDKSSLEKVFFKIVLQFLREGFESQLMELFIYSQQKKFISFLLKKMIQNEECTFGKITWLGDYFLRQWDILRINAIPPVKIHYYSLDQSLSLSGLASFIFRYERQKGINRKNRYLTSFPSQPNKYPLQFLIYVPQNLVYLVKGIMVNLIEPDQQLQQYINVIKVYFKNIDYCVVHGRQNQNGYEYCYDIYVAENHESEVYSLNYAKEEHKLIRIKKMPVKFHLTRERHLEWYEIKTHKKELNRISACFES